LYIFAAKKAMMNKKIVIITGANSGIGKAAAFEFAIAGYSVVMACRNIQRSKIVQDEIIRISKNEAVHLFEADLSSFESIRAFCEKFKDQFQKLDILINNAAYFHHGAKYRSSPDNIELTFATNVAGPYLMIMLLAGHLRKSDDPRVLNASSNIIKHFFNPKKEINFDNLQNEPIAGKKFTIYQAYRDSKMAFLMLSFRMAEFFSDVGIKVNSLQINGARMSKETLAKFKYPWKLIAHIQNLFFPPPEFMASLYFDLCTSEKFNGLTGKLFNHKSEIMLPAPENPSMAESIRQATGSYAYPNYAHRHDVSEKIWRLCREWTGVE
jgi:NAD(P)-dependent dehydrogenase (short-subunit alcohol dehydrogenase family)